VKLHAVEPADCASEINSRNLTKNQYFTWIS